MHTHHEKYRINLLPENESGKDYVIGDVHGSVQLFMQVINLLNQNDRLFIVGDLIDRGQYKKRAGSAIILDIIITHNARRKSEGYLPQIYAVRGNHEEVFIEFVSYKIQSQLDKALLKQYEHILQIFLRSGGEWALDNKHPVCDPQLILYANFLRKLPIIIHVSGKSPFNIVHADMPLDDNNLFRALESYPYLTHAEAMYALNARERTSNRNDIHIHNRGRTPSSILTYCGHSILGGARSSTNHINLDFGAYFTNTMFVMNHTDTTCLLLKPESSDMTFRPIQKTLDVTIQNYEHALHTLGEEKNMVPSMLTAAINTILQPYKVDSTNFLEIFQLLVGLESQLRKDNREALLVYHYKKEEEKEAQIAANNLLKQQALSPIRHSFYKLAIEISLLPCYKGRVMGKSKLDVLQPLIDKIDFCEIQMQQDERELIQQYLSLWNKLTRVRNTIEDVYDSRKCCFFKPSYALCHVIDRILASPDLRQLAESHTYHLNTVNVI